MGGITKQCTRATKSGVFKWAIFPGDRVIAVVGWTLSEYANTLKIEVA